MDRIMEMEGIPNIRDLGGLRAEGGTVARGRLIRSGSLHEMTGADRVALARCGVGTVIDLRSRWERRELGYGWPEVRVVSAPLVSDGLVAVINEGFRAGTLSSEELEDWWNLTRVYEAPYEHLASIKDVFRVILDAPADEAVLFHCRGGKDRTGLIAALVLEALGVDRSQVRDDFLLSNGAAAGAGIGGDGRALRDAIEARGISRKAIRALIGVRVEWLDRLLAGVDRRSGSVMRYLTDDVGLGGRGIRRLRERYLEPAG